MPICSAGAVFPVLLCALLLVGAWYSQGERRVYWDQFHNSEAVFALMARDVWAGGPNSTEPINLQTLSST